MWCLYCYTKQQSINVINSSDVDNFLLLVEDSNITRDAKTMSIKVSFLSKKLTTFFRFIYILFIINKI